MRIDFLSMSKSIVKWCSVYYNRLVARYSRTGWARSGEGPSSGTWGCTGPGSTRGAPSAPRRTSSCPGSTSHMTPKGRPPTSTPWKVSGTACRKSWRIYRTIGWKTTRYDRSDRRMMTDWALVSVTSRATPSPLHWPPLYIPRPRRPRAPRPSSHACLRRRRRLRELLNYLIGSIHFSVLLPFHASNSEKVDGWPVVRLARSLIML